MPIAVLTSISVTVAELTRPMSEGYKLLFTPCIRRPIICGRNIRGNS